MCVVSMIGDHFHDKWNPIFPSPLNPIFPSPFPTNPVPSIPTNPVMPLGTYTLNPITREEFEALRRDVLEMKALLIRAKEYDERNNEPDCETDAKVELLKKVAEMVGISLDEVFGKRK